MHEKLSASTLKKLEPGPKPFEVWDLELKGFLLRVQPSGRMTYYYAYRNTSGTRSRIKIGQAGSITPRQARDMALGYAGQTSSGLDVQGERKQARQSARLARQSTLGNFIEQQYRPWVLANRKSGQHTLEILQRYFSQWHDKQMQDIGPQLIESWRTDCLQRDLRPNTINRSVAALRAVLSKAHEWEALEHHPLERLKPLKTDNSPKIRYLSRDEEQRLTEALRARDERLKAERDKGNAFRAKRGYELLPSLREQRFADYLEPMIILSLKTGMRRGELFDITWSDLDSQVNTLTIRAEISKANRTRHIPLGPTARQALQDWRDQHPAVPGNFRIFTNSRGQRFDNTNKAWRTILKEAEINNFRWHDMRHDFASKLVMAGVPLNTVRELCGHTDMNTTLRYAHLAPEHKAEAVALLG